MGFLGQLFGLGGKGTVLVTVDKPYYISGELITGSLHVDILEPIECNEVVVLVNGKERVRWTEQHTVTRDGKSHTETRTFSEGREFFKSKLVLFNVQQHLSPGKYIYPFQYQLPTGLPGSFDNENHSNVKGKIEYAIKGTLCINGVFTRDLKHRQRLVVYAQLAGVVVPVLAEKTQIIRFLCCFNKGQCDLRVSMDKNMYGPGEVPQIHCEIRNQSSRDIVAMRSELVRVVEVHADGRNRVLRKTICCATFPGVPAGQSLSQPQSFQLIGNGMYPSTRGQIVSARYCVEVTCDIQWCPDVELLLPIALGAPILVPIVMAPTQ
ncbi:hypothetical protein SDRG_14245 [Saprolegnia diclina VS20]|uniref:Arrestin C-terminal-like domain-containing protein n=1 Tax=Saprolegnia diclina (strain VS20) TaxID=1156394 RepID=T0PR78_SAPDV|nr:hypothetical protein SDRG_14245 [Saprolegnia diclina VS20]EQC27969.1 hypothetical protein SDRG_14245 [Saprolegnia diclina VS20]|eukprot:XP_008618582.1 hypothetical protein SDRG_14245 [Saprolegnia diclina VS20]